ncbi:MAG: ribose 5-phosphate isomerase B [Parcubacteria group bacterium Gr01-1014_30]|nr:MAG: ribose 5-phosphate isomerase B [Parcubacteria group bacterium Gr01-1014_30]
MIYLAADHRGFELKEKIKEWLEGWGYEVAESKLSSPPVAGAREYEDMGAFELNPTDDYVDFVSKAAKKVSEDPENSKAIILGASGQGEAMLANKFRRVRAVVYYGGDEEIISLSREHNDANVLSLGAALGPKFEEARKMPEDLAKRVVKTWLETPFSGAERHKRRLQKIKKIETP